MTTFKCKLCGAEEDLSSYDEKCQVPSLMKVEQLCFDCAYWTNKIRFNAEHQDDGYHPVIINHEHRCYWDDQQRIPKCGGVFVKFLDGSVVHLSKLWYNGVIPERFYDQLPDNAEFITEREYYEAINNLPPAQIEK